MPWLAPVSSSRWRCWGTGNTRPRCWSFCSASHTPSSSSWTSARLGGSVVIYGSLYLALGLFFSGAFGELVQLFPLPILGVILMFEGLMLMRLVGDMAASSADFAIVLVVGLSVIGLPYGYLVGLVVGTLLASLVGRGLTGLAR